MKSLVLIIIILTAAVTGTAGYFLGINQAVPSPPRQAMPSQFELDGSIQTIIDAKMKILESIASSPVIVQGVKKSNDENRDLTEALINQRDHSWRQSKGVDGVIKPYLSNSEAQELGKFQQKNAEFTEMILTDSKGLNVGLTNKTTDYYQGDEDWWKQSFNDGKGKAFNGTIEFDDSSQTEAIALYRPIVDPQTKQAVGVLKVLLDINSIKAEL